MKHTWAKTLGTAALSMAALTWVILPARAQISPKQPRASGAAAPAMPLRTITNEQRQAAAEELASRRTFARTGNAAATNSAGHQVSVDAGGSSNPAHQNSRRAVDSSNQGRQNSRPGNETR